MGTWKSCKTPAYESSAVQVQHRNGQARDVVALGTRAHGGTARGGVETTRPHGGHPCMPPHRWARSPQGARADGRRATRLERGNASSRRRLAVARTRARGQTDRVACVRQTTGSRRGTARLDSVRLCSVRTRATTAGWDFQEISAAFLRPVSVHPHRPNITCLAIGSPVHFIYFPYLLFSSPASPFLSSFFLIPFKFLISMIPQCLPIELVFHLFYILLSYTY
ncbi:hypothetical protein SEVIR_1G066616v4 [Setaria viridis]